jgi:hypothetical protein
MTQPVNSQVLAGVVSREQYQWTNSVSGVLAGNVDMGTSSGTAPSSAGINAGVATQFNKGNGSGVLIRIAANGVAGTGAPYNWPASGSLTINHQLLRVPIGFHVVDADGNSNVYRTAAPTVNTITLATTSNAVSNTIYVF